MDISILSLALQFIEINSEKTNSDGQYKTLAIAKDLLKNFSLAEYEIEGVKSSLYYSARYTNVPGFRVLFNAHLDVVPAKEAQFKPYIQDGKLYGRGAYDMKAAAAAQILAFKELADTLPYPVGLQLVTDEEIGGFKGTKHQVDEGVRAEFIIVGEPTNLVIGHKAKGILWLKIMFHGISAHGAYLWQGRNAVLEMSNFLDGLKKIYPVPENEVWQTTVNVASVTTSNSSYNKVPDECELKLDVRFIPEDKDVVLGKIKKILPDNASVEVTLHESSQYTEPDNKDLLALKQTTESVLQKNCEIVARHGGSDLRFFELSGGKGVEFGPIGYGHHTDEEWVNLESLEEYFQILKKFLSSLS